MNLSKSEHDEDRDTFPQTSELIIEAIGLDAAHDPSCQSRTLISWCCSSEPQSPGDPWLVLDET